MKKISLMLVTVILNLALFSCTTDSDDDVFLDQFKSKQELATGDEDGTILPPPPPSSGGNGGNGGG